MTETGAFDLLPSRLAELEPVARMRPAAIEIARAPGRVNLMGEYTDVNDGFVLPAAIDLEIRIAFVASDDRRVVLHRLDSGEVGEFDLDETPARKGDWLDYAVGTAWALVAAGLTVRGLRGVIATSLPIGAGLSSSAAIELAVARALLGPSTAAILPIDLARICRRAENQYVGVQSGLMDQFASACGQAGSALLLDCRSEEWRPVPMPLDDIRLVVCDTGSARQLTASAYNLRREQCRAAVACLAGDDPAIQSLRDVTPEAVEAAARSGRLEPVLARRARHIVSENRRVLATGAALEAGDVDVVGEIFAASHRSLRDDFEVSSSALDAMIDVSIATPGVLAARMTGAGFGGCTVNLVRPDAVASLRRTVDSEYVRRTGLRPRVFAVEPADGAGFVG